MAHLIKNKYNFFQYELKYGIKIKLNNIRSTYITKKKQKFK